MFPTTFPVVLRKLPVEAMREVILCRVVGGTMSTRAAMRSKKVSSLDISESTEERDSEESLAAEEPDAYGEFDSFSSTISTLTIMIVEKQTAEKKIFGAERKRVLMV